MAIRKSGIGLPYTTGTTANRPSAPAEGTQYFNTTTGSLQIYINGSWTTYQSPVNIVAPGSIVATNQPTNRSYNNGQASVSFVPSELGGPATSYTVTSTPGSYTNTGLSSPILVTGLQSNTAYTYTVTATNSYSSAISSASSSVTATTAPQSPTIGTATRIGATGATIAFTAGATGGSAITLYTATSSPSGLTATSSSSPITFSNLDANTSYTFTVTATNANGTSAASSASNQVNPPPTVSGGVLASDATYYYRTFTQSGDFTVAAGSLSVDYMVLGGGGRRRNSKWNHYSK